jgi:hypothetical protein
MRNGMPVRFFPGKEKARRFATDPEYRASLVTAKVWRRRGNERTGPHARALPVKRQLEYSSQSLLQVKRERESPKSDCNFEAVQDNRIRHRWMISDGRCACRKLNPGILVMQPAQDWATKNVPGAIDGARDRCILLQG